MPYITKERRGEIHEGMPPQTTGELTYVLYRELMRYLNMKENLGFQCHAEIIAACDCAKEEYRRRYLQPYEDQKIMQNGDVR